MVDWLFEIIIKLSDKNMDYNSWQDAFWGSLTEVWFKFAAFLPELLGAVIVLLIGLVLAVFLGRVVENLIMRTRVDGLLERAGISRRFEEAGLGFRLSYVIGWLVKWFIILVVLATVADILDWNQINQFLNDIALYIPNVIVAVVILIIGLLAGRLVHGVVERSARASVMLAGAAGLLAEIARWAVIIFAVMAALTQLKIAANLIEVFFAGLVFAIALAFGLAFGLGGREKAKEFIDKYK